jgi:hypothetical protein
LVEEARILAEHAKQLAKQHVDIVKSINNRK